MENPIKMDDLGVPPIFENTQYSDNAYSIMFVDPEWEQSLNGSDHLELCIGVCFEN